jgi:hypothetical protein
VLGPRLAFVPLAAVAPIAAATAALPVLLLTIG